MQGTLVLAILTIRSSYARNIEAPVVPGADVPDTLQWWIAARGSWRIRTYAIDHDIHTYEIDGEPARLLALASENNRKQYGDVLAAEHVLHFAGFDDWSAVDARFRAIGLEPRLEIAADRFAFWKPDDAAYATKSGPQQ